MTIQTRQQFADAIDRLKMRDPDTLAAFIASLALHDGPIGEQVCTFIVGDDVATTGNYIERRIYALRNPRPRSRHEFGQEVGERLMFILDAIETLVLPRNSQRAFDLLKRVIAQPWLWVIGEVDGLAA